MTAMAESPLTVHRICVDCEQPINDQGTGRSWIHTTTGLYQCSGTADELDDEIDGDRLYELISRFLDPEIVDLDTAVERINMLRSVIAERSPFAGEPVDFVQWVPADSVGANDYNPNVVAPPEMELLRLSIAADGYTQPIVTMPADGGREVVDGFHRNRVGKECDEVRERLHGYLPVVTIRGDREDKSDRIASTIRHNRARGKHRIEAMSDIVIELKRRNWSNAKIARELGMDDDEVLRLCQLTGLSELFGDQDFSRAWDIEADIDAELVVPDLEFESDAEDLG